jgi:hypothetical protein
LALDICKGERPPIPEYALELYDALMKRCWDPIPANLPTAKELNDQIYDWEYIISESSYETFSKNRQIAMKQEIKKAFSNKELEEKFKERLTELAINSRLLKKSQNLFTSKRLDYFKHLTQLLETNDGRSDDGTFAFFILTNKLSIYLTCFINNL